MLRILRIIVLLGNIVGIIGVIYVGIDSSSYNQIGDYIWLLTLMIFFLLNMLFILGGSKSNISLYLKRKSLEEEIKIQEAENKLKELQDKK
jgi:Na+(H+)/acetate symporter ActP